MNNIERLVNDIIDDFFREVEMDELFTKEYAEVIRMNCETAFMDRICDFMNGTYDKRKEN
jgi:hypothetical protein